MKTVFLFASVIATSHVVSGVKQSRYSFPGIENIDVFDTESDRNELLRRPGGRGPHNKGAPKASNKKGGRDDDEDDDNSSSGGANGDIDGGNEGSANGDIGGATENSDGDAEANALDFGAVGGDTGSDAGDTGSDGGDTATIPDDVNNDSGGGDSAPLEFDEGSNSGGVDAGSGSAEGSICDDRVVSKTWNNIKLSPGNARDPFIGIDFALGLGKIELVVNTCTGFFEACAETSIQGFDVTTLQISRGKMNQNGGTVVDFSSLLEAKPSFTGCRGIPRSLYLDLVNNPDEFYLTASPGGVGPRAIRGQLLQGFMTKLSNDLTVAPYNNVVPGASGMSMLTFENEGTMACFDATINGFDPVLAHVHFGQPGSNGPIFFDFSSVKVEMGRFLGCISILDLGHTQQSVCELLADGYLYYFEFHQSVTEPGIFTTIRGQLPRLNK